MLYRFLPPWALHIAQFIYQWLTVCMACFVRHIPVDVPSSMLITLALSYRSVVPTVVLSNVVRIKMCSHCYQLCVHATWQANCHQKYRRMHPPQNLWCLECCNHYTREIPTLEPTRKEFTLSSKVPGDDQYSPLWNHCSHQMYHSLWLHRVALLQL
jgi:hypothetical protein